MDADLEKYNGEKLELHNEDEVNDVMSKLSDQFKIDSIEQKEKSKG